MRRPTRRSSPDASTAAWIRTQSTLGRRAARGLVGFGVVGVVLALGQAWCVAAVLGAAVSGAGLAHAWFPVFGFTVLALLRASLQFAAATRAASLGADARRRLRSEGLGRILGAGPALLRRRSTGDLVTLVVDGVEGLDPFFSRWLPAASLAMLGPLVVVLAVLVIDWRAALVLLVAGVAVPVLQAVFGIGAARASRRQFIALSRLQGRFLDRMRGIGTLVLSGAAVREEAALAASADELRVRTMRILRVAFLSSTALDLALVVSIVAIAILDRHALLAHRAPWAVSRALFALIVVPEFFAPLRAFALAYQDKHRLSGAAEAFASLPAVPSGPDPVSAPAIRTVEARGVTVCFEDVRFGWSAERPLVLDGLSFRVPAGETALLVGPSGAGKSTVLEILLGFVAPSGGRVTLNGAPLETIVPQALSRLTSWIGQRPVLFAGTLEENVRFGRPDASEADLLEALRASRLEALLEQLPAGLATRIGEGGHGLSGGQAQRVAVARAFLKNAPLLLLDEPTSHLDPATEGELLQSLRRLALGRTVILATHSAAATLFPGRRITLGGPGTAAGVSLAGAGA